MGWLRAEPLGTVVAQACSPPWGQGRKPQRVQDVHPQIFASPNALQNKAPGCTRTLVLAGKAAAMQAAPPP